MKNDILHAPIVRDFVLPVLLVVTGGSLANAQTLVVDQSNGNSPYVVSNGAQSFSTVDVGSTSTGELDLNGGILITGIVGTLGGTSTFDLNGGTLQANASTTSFFQGLNTANVEAGGATIDTQRYSVSIAQSLLHNTASGAPTTDGGLTKLGAGTLTLTGVNTYTGTTTVTAGILEAAAPASLPGYNTAGKVTANSNATLAVDVGGNVQWTSANLDTLRGDATFGTGSALGLDTTGATSPFIYASNISGSQGITKLGAGTLTLSGANTYTGATTVDAGTLQAGVATNAFGNNTAVVLANTSGATLDLNGNSEAVGSLSGGGTSGGGVTLGTGTLTVGGNNASTSYAGVISGGGALTKTGSGTLTLTGSNNYTGGTNINAGILELGTTGALPSSGAVAVNSGGTLAAATSVSTTSATLDSVRSNANVTFNAGSAFGVDTGTNTAVFTYSSNVSGVEALVKLGTGTGALILTGANTYTGGTTFAAGTLNVGSTGALGNSGTLSFTGGSLQYSSANTTDYSSRFSTAAGQAYNIDTNGQNVTFATGLTSSGGSLTKLGAGTLTLTGTSTYQSETNVNGGTLIFGKGSSLTNSVEVMVNAGASLSIDGGNVNLPSTSGLEVGGTSGGASAMATLTATPGSNLSTGTVNIGYTGVGIFTQTGGAFTINGNPAYNANVMYLGNYPQGSGTYIQSGGTLTAGRVYVGYLGSGSYSLSGSASLSVNGITVGNGGTGTFTQSGGTVTTNGGFLTIGFGTSGSGMYTLSGGTLTTSSTLIGEGITPGTFNQTGGLFTTSTLNLTGNSTSAVATYTLGGGTLNIGTVTSGDGQTSTVGTSTFYFNGGRLQAAKSTAGFFSGLTTANVQTNGATIDTDGYNVTIAQRLVHDTTSGAPALDGGLVKLGQGILTLAAANTYTGTTTVSLGTLAVSVNGGLGIGSVSIAAGATLSLGTGVTAAHNASTSTILTLASATTSIINLAGTGVQDTVGTLIVNGLTEPVGTYGAAGSGATYTNIADFMGTGELLVVPEPSTWAMLAAGGMLLAVAVRHRLTA